MNKQIIESLKPSTKNLVVVYALAFGSIIMPLFTLISAILAFAHKDISDRFLSSHYNFIVNSFYLSMLGYLFLRFYASSGSFNTILSIILYVWYTARLIFGLKYLINGSEILNPKTLWI